MRIYISANPRFDHASLHTIFGLGYSYVSYVTFDKRGTLKLNVFAIQRLKDVEICVKFKRKVRLHVLRMNFFNKPKISIAKRRNDCTVSDITKCVTMHSGQNISKISLAVSVFVLF